MIGNKKSNRVKKYKFRREKRLRGNRVLYEYQLLNIILSDNIWDPFLLALFVSAGLLIVLVHYLSIEVNRRADELIEKSDDDDATLPFRYNHIEYIIKITEYLEVLLY